MNQTRISMPGTYAAFPETAIDVPESWDGFVWPGAAFGVRKTVDGDPFAPNVLITLERWPGNIDLDDAAKVLSQRMTAAGAEDVEQQQHGESFTMTAKQHDPNLGAMRVQYCLRVIAGEGFTDAITAVGTCTVDQDELIGDEINGIVRSLAVESSMVTTIDRDTAA